VKGNILIVDDDIEMCKTVEKYLQLHGFKVTWVTSAKDAMVLIEKELYDTVLTDLRMPQMDGIDLCAHIGESQPDIPIILMTAFGSLETAIRAIRAGIYDFITKPIEMEILSLTLDRAVSHRRLKGQIQLLNDMVLKSRPSGDIVGASVSMEKLFNKLDVIRDSEISVMLAGESGTGKDLVAKMIHNDSQRKNGPFVPVNCAALPEMILESELFGHTRGAFTDAKTTRKGMFLHADGGTLFLDEIGELPLSLQPKLLRALEERKIRPVGSDKEISVNVRVITATNKDLEKAIKDGDFREDLFYRINVMQFIIPPLRDRGTDIVLLAKYFMEQFSQRSGKKVNDISQPVMERLLNYSWKGNVRELKNIMERAVALTRHNQIVLEDLPEAIRSFQSKTYSDENSNFIDLISMDKIEQQYIEFVLKKVDGNKKRAADILGFDRRTLYRKLASYENADHTH